MTVLESMTRLYREIIGMGRPNRTTRADRRWELESGRCGRLSNGGAFLAQEYLYFVANFLRYSRRYSKNGRLSKHGGGKNS